jgi:hypothetical protein
MKPSTLFLLLTVSLVMLPQTSQAQRIASPAFALFRPAPTSPPARPASFSGSAPDYRWEGLAIGAFVGGAFAAFFVARSGEGGTCSGCFGEAVGVTLLGAAAGGLLGGFAGLVTPKNHPASTD